MNQLLIYKTVLYCYNKAYTYLTAFTLTCWGARSENEKILNVKEVDNTSASDII